MIVSGYSFRLSSEVQKTRWAHWGWTRSQPWAGGSTWSMGSASGAGRADPDRRASPSYTLSCQRARDSGTAPGIQHIPEDSDRLRLYQDIRVGLARQGHGWTGQGSGSWRLTLLHPWDRWWWHWEVPWDPGLWAGVALMRLDRDSQSSGLCRVCTTSTPLFIFSIYCSWFSSTPFKNSSLLFTFITQIRFQNNIWISNLCICGDDTVFIFYW